LGASSLDELLTGLDSLSRAATSTSGAVSDARGARATISALSRSLARRARLLRRLRDAAATRAQSLAAARAARAVYIGRLQTERSLTAERIVTLKAEAAAAQASARTATIAAQAAPTTAAFLARPLPPAPLTTAGRLDDPVLQPASGYRLTVLATGYSLEGTTATGLPVESGVVAVDPSVIPLGTRMAIPGYGQGVAADTGSAIQGPRIDLWFPTRAAALAWGWRTVTIVLR
jgi:3D (Asp-Asp-Asp) domain-containing protein